METPLDGEKGSSRSMEQLVSLLVSVCLCRSLSLSLCRSVYLSVYFSRFLFVCLPICLSVYLSQFLSLCLPVCLSVYLSVCLFFFFSYVAVYNCIHLKRQQSNYL